MQSDFSEEQLKQGSIVLYFIGVGYFISMLNKLHEHFWYNITEDLSNQDSQDEQAHRIYTYSHYMSVPFLVLAFCGAFQTNNNIGYACILGSNALNIQLITGIFFYYRTQNNQTCQMDGFLVVRDTFFAIAFDILMGIMFYNKDFTIINSIGIIFLYYFHRFCINNSTFLKNFIFLIIGLRHEDDSFDATDNIAQLKTRYTIEEIKQFGSKSDPLLLKKLNRNQTNIVLENPDDINKQRILYNFHKVVLQVVFCIKNHIKDQKNQQSKYFNSLDLNEDDEDKIEVKDDSSSVNSSQQSENTKKQKELDEEQLKLLDNKCSQTIQVKDHLILRYDGDGTYLSYIHYGYFLPIKLLLSLIPDSRKNPKIKTMIQSLTICYGITIGCIYMMNSWNETITQTLGISVDTWYITLMAFAYNFPFIAYNYKLASQNQINYDFTQSYMVLGTYRTGFLNGFVLFVQLLFQDANIGKNPIGIAYCYFINGSCSFCLLLFMALFQFKIKKNFHYINACFFMVFIVASIILCETDLN